MAHKMTADRLLDLLLDQADVETGPDGKARLVIAAEPWLLDELAAHGADDREDNGDHEPNVTTPDGQRSYQQSYDVDHELTTVRQWRAW